MLIDNLLTSENEEIRLAAASALATYAFPEEQTKGIRETIYQKGGLEPLLKLASLGKIGVHNEIDPKEITIEEEVATGASGRVHKVIFF